MEVGIARFATPIAIRRSEQDGELVSPVDSLLAEATLADEIGIDAFSIGEHHSSEFIDSAQTMLLAAVAARTQNIRLTSGITVLSAADPVRVFEQFATLDLISRGRAEIVVGRGAYAEAFSLFGLDVRDYDAMFAEKLELLLALRAETNVHWTGLFRPPLSGQGVYPRPVQRELPIWVGVTGTPASAQRAGMLGLPLALGIIGGQFSAYRPLVDLYRAAGREAGHGRESLKVGVNCIGFCADSRVQALNEFFPAYAEIFGPIGERAGWPALTVSRFEALCSDTGALVVGGPVEVAAKLKHIDEVLDGVSRISLQMSLGSMPLDSRLRALTLLGMQKNGVGYGK